MNPIQHVAIIMDGNGRWGLKKKKSRNLGHKEGLKTAEKIIEETIKNKIKYLTLFAFSTENWKRPKKEVSFLFNLLENFLINSPNFLSIKLFNSLNKNLISFFGLFQFSVENAYRVKYLILFLIETLIIFSTVLSPSL